MEFSYWFVSSFVTTWQKRGIFMSEWPAHWFLWIVWKVINTFNSRLAVWRHNTRRCEERSHKVGEGNADFAIPTIIDEALTISQAIISSLSGNNFLSLGKPNIFVFTNFRCFLFYGTTRFPKLIHIMLIICQKSWLKLIDIAFHLD